MKGDEFRLRDKKNRPLPMARDMIGTAGSFYDKKNKDDYEKTLDKNLRSKLFKKMQKACEEKQKDVMSKKKSSLI